MKANLTLNNGIEMPPIGLGVFQTPFDETAAAVDAALRVGYRHVDTAAIYGNERAVGEGILRSGLDRSEVFVETKVWISDYGYDATLHAFDKSVKKLGTDYLDLFILHQALPSRFDLTVQAYKALERLTSDGHVRSIGVSNFTRTHIEHLLGEVSVVPAVNQIESHPYFRQPDVEAADDERSILTQAWSPIGGITTYRENGHTDLLADPTVVRVADGHGKSPAQVLLRWGLQNGRSVIPKSSRAERIAENFDVFDFDLTPDELAAFDGLETGRRGGPEPEDHRLDTTGRNLIPEA